MNEVKEGLSCFRYMFGILRKCNQNYIWITICEVLIKVISDWIVILFIGSILEKLKCGNAHEAMLLIIIMLFLLMIFNAGRHIIEGKQRVIHKEINEYLNVSVYKKMTALSYSELLKAETKKSHEFAKIVLNEVGIDKLYEDLNGILFSLFNVFCSISSILFINFYVVIAIVFVTIINFASEIYKFKCKYSVDQETAEVELNLYYARDYLATPKFAKEIRLFHLVDFISKKVVKYIKEFCEMKLLSEKRYLRKFWVVFFLDATIMLIVYLQGINDFSAGEMGIGEFSVYLSAMLLLSSSLSNIVKRSASLDNSTKYIQALKNFLNLENKPKVKEEGNYQGSPNYLIEFKNVCFKYKNTEKLIIDNISFKIEEGEKIAIVGRNGAGKTTIILLLLGFLQPTSGKIFVNGKEQQQYERSEYINLFSGVLQDFNIFPFTFEENIVMGKNVDEDRFTKSVNLVEMDDRVQKLPEGRYTYMSQRFSQTGEELSGGEQQKAAFARALYKNSPILIFDEPTSALSPQSEFEIYKKFNEITNNRTVFFISHRLASCKLCNRIIVLDNGCIVEEEGHDKLMNERGLYYSMFTAQLEGFIKEGEDENKGNNC